MTFDVAAGRVTGFVGPNGAGKSTTMRMMVGLTRPDHGDVRYHGVSYTQLQHPTRVVGSVLDAGAMHPGRTARNHLQAMAALSSIPARRVDEVLHEVGLDTAADQRAGGFSLGMRQRLALAGALLGEPEVLLLDEPSNGLDPDGIRWLRNSLSDFAARGGTVFVSSHLIGELDDVRRRPRRGGRRQAAGRRAGGRHARPWRDHRGRAHAGCPELARLLDRRRTASPSSSTATASPSTGTTLAAVSQIAFDHRIQVVEITEASRSLEEILLDMTGATAEFAAA